MHHGFEIGLVCHLRLGLLFLITEQPWHGLCCMLLSGRYGLGWDHTIRDLAAHCSTSLFIGILTLLLPCSINRTYCRCGVFSNSLIDNAWFYNVWWVELILAEPWIGIHVERKDVWSLSLPEKVARCSWEGLGRGPSMNGVFDVLLWTGWGDVMSGLIRCWVESRVLCCWQVLGT